MGRFSRIVYPLIGAQAVGSADKEVAALLVAHSQYGLKTLGHRLLEPLAFLLIGADVGARLEGFAFSGRWPVHQLRRITLNLEKLCPVHRGLIAMSGRAFGGCPRVSRLRLESSVGKPALSLPNRRCPFSTLEPLFRF